MSSPILRDYQVQLERDIYEQWQRGAHAVLAVAPTGSGKTVTMSDIIRKTNAPAVAIAHRQELVSQMSLALARNNVRHRIIGQKSTIRNCVQIHMADLGVSHYHASAHIAVAGVDTLVRMDPKDPWFTRVQLWVIDEAHHLVEPNKWYRTAQMFPNARGLGVTATACRADGKGLGRHADGLFDSMVIAPGMRELIDDGYLSEYRVFAPASNIDMSKVNVTASGDFSPEPLRAAVHKSTIVGDVVAHYLRIAPGKLGVTFAVDVESAKELAAAFRQAGVPAECISAKTPDLVRYKLLQRFARGEIKQLCNVDLFGEGFDLPAIEVTSMARPTQSFGLFVQQFGRALRPLEGKEHAFIIDHVNNCLRHGLPDAPRLWSLERREKKSKSSDNTVLIRVCPNCTGVYERFLTKCPYCQHVPVPAGRSLPEQVDGDLQELTPEALAALRGAIADSEELRIPYSATPSVRGYLQRVHRERAEAQRVLREEMALWGGAHTAQGMSISEAQRKFYLQYGIDVLSAQALNAKDAIQLTGRIRGVAVTPYKLGRSRSRTAWEIDKEWKRMESETNKEWERNL